MELIGVIAVVYGIVMCVVGIDAMIIMYMCALLFQAAAVVKLGDFGIPPGHMLLALVLCVVIVKDKFAVMRMWAVVQFPRAGFAFALLVAYCIMSAFILPRLFQYGTYVYPIGRTAFAISDSPVPLGPSSGNFTQTLYITGSALAFVIVSSLLDTPERMTTIMHAVLAYAGVNLIFAGLDLVSFWTGTAWMLDFVHNGNYAFHLDETEVGLKRIAGSFSEASAFAAATLGMLGFTLRLWLGGVLPRLTFTLTMIEIAVLILSTSSTAYAGLAVVMATLYGTSLMSFSARNATRPTLAFVVFGPPVLGLIVLGVALNKSMWSSVVDVLQSVVLDKSQSESALARGAWNAQAIVNFLDTKGLGAGTGSVRTSSFPLAVLANIGIPGALCYGAALCAVFFRRSPLGNRSLTWTIQAACRAGAFGILVAATISGSLIDLGLPFFVIAAAACAPIMPEPAPEMHPSTRDRTARYEMSNTPEGYRAG